MKTTKKTTNPKEIIIDLNEFTPAERKMYDLGGFIAVKKYAPETFRKDETAVHYFQCNSKPVSDHQIIVPIDFSANRNIEFDLVNKTFLTTFARLDYNMLCAVLERCKELGWYKDDKQALEICKKIMFVNPCCNADGTYTNITRGNAWQSTPDEDGYGYMKDNFNLLQIVKKCMADNFPIQDYLLFEIPYGDSEGTLIDFVNTEDYENYHIKGMGNHIRCIDFWVAKEGKVTPMKTVHHNTNEVDNCWEAVYLDNEL